MSKKVILTETQYNKLMEFINETPFDKVVNNSIKVGDIIRIDWGNDLTSHFKVISVNNGNIIMDNVDAGSTNVNFRYLMNQDSLKGKKLELKRVHKIKEKDKLEDTSTWKIIPVNGIKNIDVLRGDEVVDSVDDPDMNDIDRFINVFTESVEEGMGVNLTLGDGSIINLCCVSSALGDYEFTLATKPSNPNLAKCKSVAFRFIIGNGEVEGETPSNLNHNIVTSDDGGKTKNVRVGCNIADVEKNFWLQNITNIELESTCKAVEKEKEKNTKMGGDTHTKEEAEEIMHAILNDPLMKKTFYRKPTLWNMIVSAVKGQNPTGSGIGPAKEILSKYGESKRRRVLGQYADKFKNGKWAKFEVLFEGVEINPTGDINDKLILQPNKPYRAKVTAPQLGHEDNTILEDTKIGMKIKVIKPYKDLPDTFEVTIIKTVISKETREVKEFPKSAIVKFIDENGSGYSKSEKQMTTTTKLKTGNTKNTK